MLRLLSRVAPGVARFLPVDCGGGLCRPRLLLRGFGMTVTVMMPARRREHLKRHIDAVRDGAELVAFRDVLRGLGDLSDAEVLHAMRSRFVALRVEWLAGGVA